jgi:hypothetical protein
MKRHKWSDIKARSKPETRARIEAEAQRLSNDLHLSQLRKARGLTQETMAELLGERMVKHDTGARLLRFSSSAVASATMMPSGTYITV